MPNAGPTPREEWTHYALTFDKLTGQIIIYENGTELNSLMLSPGSRAIHPDDGKLVIGRYAVDGSDFAYGEATVDDLMFYDRVLNATEINAIASVYNATMG